MADAPKENLAPAAPVAPPAAPTAPVAPPATPLSGTERVLKAARESKDEKLELDDLKKVIDDRTKLVEEAKKMTGSALDQLSATLRREQQEHEVDLTTENIKDELEEMRAQIDAEAVKKASTVNDVEAIADPNKPKTIVDQLRNFSNAIGLASIGGTLLRWVKNIRNTLIDFGLPLGEKSALDKAEENFNAFFGAAEVRDLANGALKDSGIEVRKGSKDTAGYLKIQSRYNAALAAKLLEIGGKDATGKPIEIPPAMKKQVEGQFPFRAFLEQEVKAYAAKHNAPAPAGQKRVTTLSGIANSEKPVNSPA